MNGAPSHGSRFAHLKPRLDIVVGDITTLDVDAIVNAANEGLIAGGGVCGAIYRAAGPELAKSCFAVAPCPTGQARITPGHGLKARFIIHAVGPIYQGGHADEATLLASAYTHALALAASKAIHTIAFPCISTGIYGYPPAQAAAVALEAVAQWMEKQPLPGKVIFCCFREDDAAIYRALLETACLNTSA